MKEKRRRRNTGERNKKEGRTEEKWRRKRMGEERRKQETNKIRIHYSVATLSRHLDPESTD